MAYNIGFLPGDGIGPEVTAEARKALDATGVKYDAVEFDLGAKRYNATGEVLPDTVVGEIKQLNGMLLGAVGDPSVPPGVLERGLLLRLRFELDLYVNLRPVKLYPGVPTPLANKEPDDIDIVVVRENVEGLYTGAGGVYKQGSVFEVATQESINTRRNVDRVMNYAFDVAATRRHSLTMVHKTNVLTHAGGLWTRSFEAVGKQFPNVGTGYDHIDAACLYFVTQPERYDVVVTDNMFGDIITDLGAAIAGGMGLAASGNIHPGRLGIFEPVHGSAPDIAGKGWANPVAAVLSAGMLLDTLGETFAARRVEDAAVTALGKLKAMGGERMGYSTSEIGDMIAEAI
jgi:3-isopropylmalate dehydrogenase